MIGPHSTIEGFPLRLLTPDELAKMLRISKTSVYRLVERRVIRFYRIAGSLRFDERDVTAFIQSGCVEPVR